MTELDEQARLVQRRRVMLAAPRIPPPLERVEPFCLGFRNLGPGTERTWCAQPAVPFRILGLMVWGVTIETLITRCQVGNLVHAMASADPVPALFYATGLSFAELLASVTDNDGRPLPLRGSRRARGGKLEPPDYFAGWLKARPHVEPRQLLSFKTLSAGLQFNITTQGPIHQLVAWGLGLRSERWTTESEETDEYDR